MKAICTRPDLPMSRYGLAGGPLDRIDILE
jgi:hypothetical protein